MNDIFEGANFKFDVEDYIYSCREEIMHVEDELSEIDKKIKEIDNESFSTKLFYHAKLKRRREYLVEQKERVMKRYDKLNDELNFYRKNGLDVSEMKDAEKYKVYIEDRTTKLNIVNMIELGMM